HAASQASDAEPRRLFGRENEKLDGAAWPEPELLKDANRFQPAQHAHAAVVESGIRNRINVRAGADGSQVRFRTLPASERIADRVLGNRQARIGAQSLYVCAGA